MNQVLAPMLFRALGLAVLALPLSALAQLYDPLPPADSAYLRVVQVKSRTAVDIVVDGKLRQKGLNVGQAGPYVVVTAGKHNVEIHATGTTQQVARLAVETFAGRAYTVAVPALAAAPVVLEDKTNANKLKAMLSVVNLAESTGAVDITTLDGATKVFSDLAPNASAGLPVNPINVELQVSKAGDKKGVAKVGLNLAAGSAYTIVLQNSAPDKVSAVLYPNSVERYVAP